MGKVINVFFLCLTLTACGQEQKTNTDVNEVLIGYFGPHTSTNTECSDMFAAASLAIEEANRSGGYNGIPFRLIQGWSQDPWGSGVKEVVRMAYEHKVRAIIGGIDGPSTHLAEQVVAKARLALLSAASTDKSVNLAYVPWMFSALPGDHLQSPVLAEAISSKNNLPCILVSATDHDSHLFTVELLKSFDKYHIAPSYHFEFKAGQKDHAGLVEKILDIKANSLIVIAGANDSASFIRAVRKKDFKGDIFGGPSLGSRCFLEKAGLSAENVVFPVLYLPNKKTDSFEKEFISRVGKRPDYLAAHTYDTVNLLISAIKKAGLDRTEIRDTIRDTASWSGITGKFKWDRHGANTRKVRLGTIRSGRVVSVSKLRDPD